MVRGEEVSGAGWRGNPLQRLMSVGGKVTFRRGGEEEPLREGESYCRCNV